MLHQTDNAFIATQVVNSYDVMDRLVRRDIIPGAGVANDTTSESYQYDELGRPVRATNDRQSVECNYDALSHVVREVQDGQEVRSTYDSRGRRTAVSYPSGYRLDFEYDGSDLRRVADPRGVVIELEAGGTKRYPKTQGPVISTAALNEAGLPERLVTASGATIFDERRYRWDESGNLVGVEVQDSRGKRSISYMLDSLGRLHRSSTSTDQDVEYELDPAGNRTLVRMDGGAGRYSMEGLDRAARRRRTYDLNGNLLTVTDHRGHRRSMRYDYLNRMVEYLDEAIRSVTRYSYDCLGRRVAKSSSIGEKRLEIKLVNSSGSWAHASSIFGEQLDKLPLSRYTVNV